MSTPIGPRVHIKSEGASSNGAVVLFDGKPLPGVVRVTATLALDQAVRVVADVIAEGLDVACDAAVVELVRAGAALHRANVYAWVIERGEAAVPDYFIGFPTTPQIGAPARFALWQRGPGAHDAALRFARQEDAQRMLDQLPHPGDRDGARVAEHGWT